MSMSEASKNILRHQVLELRKGYRIARERWLAAVKETKSAYSTCQVLRDSIQTVQRDCGDPISIDPSYPEDDEYFRPLESDPDDAGRSTPAGAPPEHERGRVHERGPGVSTCTPEIKQTLQRVLDGYQRAADLNEAARRWVLSL